MADSSEIQSKPDAELQRSKRDQQDSSFLETLVPIPDFFFNIKAEIEPIGGSKWRIRIFGYILYFITLCVMFGSFAYYSLPAQRVSLESIVTSEWQKPGFVCKPLQKTTLHGLSTDWSFDECLANVKPPDTTNVKAATKHANNVHYDYDFASDGDSNKGVISFYDERYASSVLQKTNQASEDWKRDGYSCYPEPPYDNTYNLNYNYTECFDAVKVPGEDSVTSTTSSSDSFAYYPFGTDNLEYAYGNANVYRRLENIHCCTRWCGPLLPGGARVANGDPGVRVKASYCASSSSLDLESAISAWKEILETPADQYGSFGNQLICSVFKLNGNGFRCFDKPKPPTTKELAIQRYASEYPPATICAPLKLNSPFQCARNVEVPATTRLSLSVAAAQAVFALTGIALVALLRKFQKPSTTTSESLSTDGDLRSMMRKLRNEFHSTCDQLRTGQDQLRTGQDQLRTGQDQLRTGQDQLRTGQDQLRTGQDQLRTGQDQLRTGQGRHEELIQKLLSKEGGR
ncbi:hypothetical protein MICPUN_64982 [Micromonas commoda]|uniref:Uncharacterized protein n=1 Tax=Micromonas commoda (strain RCC299 / NOUM17 / CCMP2709) TaxID=296587 RepID=C1EJL6_MICCC|nr:hypothetical protein MICPUN_64982 [Micromonas commoda]ACO68251.1 hypothetical protein MICPUN_64982 [Micromonas commoda]|eukprot:XP_002506993.1 hypothetical protein MICPUN_64982 [Micromonas commoda]